MKSLVLGNGLPVSPQHQISQSLTARLGISRTSKFPVSDDASENPARAPPVSFPLVPFLVWTQTIRPRVLSARWFFAIGRPLILQEFRPSPSPFELPRRPQLFCGKAPFRSQTAEFCCEVGFGKDLFSKKQSIATKQHENPIVCHCGLSPTLFAIAGAPRFHSPGKNPPFLGDAISPSPPPDLIDGALKLKRKGT